MLAGRPVAPKMSSNSRRSRSNSPNRLPGKLSIDSYMGVPPFENGLDASLRFRLSKHLKGEMVPPPRLSRGLPVIVAAVSASAPAPMASTVVLAAHPDL